MKVLFLFTFLSVFAFTSTPSDPVVNSEELSSISVEIEYNNGDFVSETVSVNDVVNNCISFSDSEVFSCTYRARSGSDCSATAATCSVARSMFVSCLRAEGHDIV